MSEGNINQNLIFIGRRHHDYQIRLASDTVYNGGYLWGVGKMMLKILFVLGMLAIVIVIGFVWWAVALWRSIKKNGF